LQNVTILGSTGTIGQQTLDVIKQHPEKYRVYALAANANVEGILAQCLAFQPSYAVLLDPNAANTLREKLAQTDCRTEVMAGMLALEQISSANEVHVVMAAIVGAAGLRPALAAASAGKRILLANKETLVMAGHLFMQAVQQGGATLLPIDSEHNAIFQVMPSQKYSQLVDGGVKKIILTASGGPFRQYSKAQLQQVTSELALKHPNWVMGAKITIDSATLMNKGLEVIEAHWLFNAAPEQIEVVVHPQSVIHSMVEYIDGSVLAQLGNPDMRTPIAYALGYPARIASGVASLNLLEIAKLEFEAPDTERFPCLRLAFEALQLNGTAATVLNAANEIAVSAFLSKQIRFVDVPSLILDAMTAMDNQPVESLEQLFEVDTQSRAYATTWVKKTGQHKALSA
jgi:1-deoxy-D-xylulose-5-phosphate reductoisomerase